MFSHALGGREVLHFEEVKGEVTRGSYLYLSDVYGKPKVFIPLPSRNQFREEEGRVPCFVKHLLRGEFCVVYISGNLHRGSICYKADHTLLLQSTPWIKRLTSLGFID